METGALIAALQALAPAATPAALRRVLHALIDDEAIPDTATPPVSSDGAAGRLLDSPDVPEAAPSRLAERTTRPPSRIHPARDPGAPSKGSNADRDWLRLREQVRTEQARRGLDRAELARVLGLAASTLGKTLNHRTAPSRPITDRLTRFVADLGATPVAKGVYRRPVRGRTGRDRPGRLRRPRARRTGRGRKGSGGRIRSRNWPSG